MVDNVTLDPGAGGAVIATDDDATAHHQYVKVEFGPDNTQTKVTASVGLPVKVIEGVTPGIGAADLGKAEDAAHSSADVGVMALAVRRAADTPTSGADGDYEPLKTDANGHLKVEIFDGGDSHTIDGTVTANLSATDNAVLDTIDAVLDTINAKLITGTVIGDVNTVSQIPGTGATNLGKAIDSVVGSTDTGVAMLGKHKEDLVHLTSADDDYDVLLLDSLGQLHVNAEGHHIFDEMDVTTGWAALGNDTLNLATTLKHVLGTAALTFDKVDGAANTVFAGIDKTLSSTDLGDISPHDLIQAVCYIPDVTNVSYVFIRLGTDNANYNEWRVEDTAITAATFEILALSIGDANHAGITGNGWDPSAITYAAVGVAFDAEGDTLAGIIFDELSYHTNQHTSAALNSEVSSSVSSANVNLQKVGGSATDKGAGNASNGSQRIVIATDDVNLAAIKTAVELMDTVGGGTEAAAARVTIASDSTGVLSVDDNGGSITVDGTVTANLSATDNAVLDTIDAVLDTINAKLVTGTVIGDVNLGATDNAVLDSIVTNQSARATGGHSFYLNQDTSAVASVKASAGTLYWIACMSTDATPVYLNLYNVASGSVTLGTTTPDLQFIVPTQGDSNGAGFTINFGPHGIQFGTAITVAAATTFNGSTDPGTNVVITNMGFE